MAKSETITNRFPPITLIAKRVFSVRLLLSVRGMRRRSTFVAAERQPSDTHCRTSWIDCSASNSVEKWHRLRPCRTSSCFPWRGTSPLLPGSTSSSLWYIFSGDHLKRKRTFTIYLSEHVRALREEMRAFSAEISPGERDRPLTAHGECIQEFPLRDSHSLRKWETDNVAPQMSSRSGTVARLRLRSTR